MYRRVFVVGLWIISFTSVFLGAGCNEPRRLDDVGVPADSGVDTGPVDTGPIDTGVDTGPDVGYVDVTLYTPVELPDDELAAAAFTILAGEDDDALSCTTCHGLTLDRVRGWGDATNAALDCIEGLDPNVPEEVDVILACFQDADMDMETTYEVMSLLMIAVPHAWFTRLLEVEYFEAMDTIEADIYQRRFTMPRRPVDILEQPEVDIVLSWVRAGMPEIEAHIDGGGTRCVPSIGPEVAAHVTAMETEGWAVLNRDRGLVMWGCEGAEVGVECLSTLPDSSERTFAEDWAIDGTLRILYETDYRSSYWTRSSADGRFVSHGGGRSGGSSIIDLERGVVIAADALYDPGFFPDNAGFVLQGVGGTDGGFCPQSLLEAEPSAIDFLEPGCSIFGEVGLYQHVGAVDGGDYWTIFGQFVSDNGGHARTGPLGVSFSSRSRTWYLPVIDEGDGYSPRAGVPIATPYEGDAVLSPSGRLSLARVNGPGGAQAGFALRQVEATPSGDSYAVTATEIARFCDRGAKVGFSFDERYVVYHRYVAGSDAVELGFTGPEDPGFAPYAAAGAANLYLLDLVNGDRRRITHMGPGQYALFPHFRSDGWIYFIVRDPTDGITGEVVVASDAALVTPP